MNIGTLASYGIAVMGNHCINCAEYIQYYCQRKDGNYTIHTAVDRGYCGARQCITRPGNRCKHYQEKAQMEGRVNPRDVDFQKEMGSVRKESVRP